METEKTEKIVVSNKLHLYHKTIAWLEEAQYDMQALRACPEQVGFDLVDVLDGASLVRLMWCSGFVGVCTKALRRANHEKRLAHLSLLKVVLTHRFPSVQRQAAYYLLSRPHPAAAALHPAVRAQIPNLDLFQGFKEFGPVGWTLDVRTRREDGGFRRLDTSALPSGWVFEFNCRGPEATWFALEQDARFRLQQCVEEYRAMPKHAQYVRMESEDSAILTQDEGTVARVYQVEGK